ncbi:agamous-like MADS-box protein MADS4 [Daucus carota subsp. sativus]|uniref:agamous-like MADS-box protein MADS4 n=1 Tax=Daucus carota subsp. sativus TaxID=79200 RepID=UPI0007EF9809|nr:PREDICTED: agamous-like MADS-box protein AGL9 homolog [Daucus carota subsp. sativus]
MGKGRVELKRIENKINRQVTFAKRRNGLLKKAYELSVLCDAEVALIVFSTRGKLYEFSSTSSIMKTLERYQKINYGPPDVNARSIQEELERSSYQEYMKLKHRYDSLKQLERNFNGDDLGSLNRKDLDSLEKQIDFSLREIRSDRTQRMLDELDKLQQQEYLLHESNIDLHGRLEEGKQQAEGLQWDPSTNGVVYFRQVAPQTSDIFYHQLFCETTSQIGCQAEKMSAVPSGPSANNQMQIW